MKRQLILTADERAWPKDKKQPVLFLGEWCKLYSRKKRWQDLDSKTLPYHWDDREKLYQDTIYLDKLYEKLLPQLADNLNKIHNTNYSLRYWRIIVGWWLNYFISITYDRYLSIKSLDVSKVKSCKMIDIISVARHNREFIEWAENDLYNQKIYIDIIKNLNYFKVEKILKKELETVKTAIEKQHFWLKTFLFGGYLRLLPLVFKKHIFFYSYLRPRNLIKLQLKLKQTLHLEFTKITYKEIGINYIKRNKFIFNKVNDEFANTVLAMIPKYIPKSYVESFVDIKKQVNKKYPNNPKTITTASAHLNNDGFKIWAAEMVEKGSKLFISQHGGNDGTAKWSFYLKHEFEIADKFISWGWNKWQGHQATPLPANKLSYKINYNPKGDILLVCMSLPRYSYHLYSSPVSQQVLIYIQEQINIAKKLNPKLRKLIKYRIYKIDYGWGIKQRITDTGFGDLIDSQTNLNKNFYQRLSECRLCVTTYNATTFLETFSANYPTLIFWDKKYWELSNEAKPYYNELLNIGILHYTVESLVKRLEQVYENPMKWWLQEDVQMVVNKFSKQFAYTSKNWLNEWKGIYKL